MSIEYFKTADPIKGKTRTLATEQDEYFNLEIRDEALDDGANCMVSKWTPTPSQLAMLNGGGSIYLGIMGEVHPRVLMAVSLTDSHE